MNPDEGCTSQLLVRDTTPSSVVSLVLTTSLGDDECERCETSLPVGTGTRFARTCTATGPASAGVTGSARSSPCRPSPRARAAARGGRGRSGGRAPTGVCLPLSLAQVASDAVVCRGSDHCCCPDAACRPPTTPGSSPRRAMCSCSVITVQAIDSAPVAARATAAALVHAWARPVAMKLICTSAHPREDVPMDGPVVGQQVDGFVEVDLTPGGDLHHSDVHRAHVGSFHSRSAHRPTREQSRAKYRPPDGAG